MRKTDTLKKHSLSTRLFHLLLALAVILQLLTSLAMQGPDKDRPGDTLFEIHEFSGLSALLLTLGVWLVVALRRRGTDAGQLWPWFSAVRRRALAADTHHHWNTIKSLRLPAYEPEASLPSAVHGLGLLLITAMAVSGATYYVALLIGTTDTWAFSLVLEVHKLLANLAWAYLIGHAGLALIHHFMGDLPLAEMWSLRRRDTVSLD